MPSHPKAREGLLRHELDGQTVVYDPTTERVHLLDATTGCVLELLDGTRSREALARELTRRLGRSCDHELVALALDELARADLLDEEARPETPLDEPARRDLLKKLALTTAAVLIPTVLSVRTTEAQSGALATGAVCSTNGQCASNTCSGSRCCAGSGTGGPGSRCLVGNAECCSGQCTATFCA